MQLNCDILIYIYLSIYVCIYNDVNGSYLRAEEFQKSVKLNFVCTDHLLVSDPTMKQAKTKPTFPPVGTDLTLDRLGWVVAGTI